MALAYICPIYKKKKKREVLKQNVKLLLSLPTPIPVSPNDALRNYYGCLFRLYEAGPPRPYLSSICRNQQVLDPLLISWSDGGRGILGNFQTPLNGAGSGSARRLHTRHTWPYANQKQCHMTRHLHQSAHRSLTVVCGFHVSDIQ